MSKKWLGELLESKKDLELCGNRCKKVRRLSKTYRVVEYLDDTAKFPKPFC